MKKSDINAISVDKLGLSLLFFVPMLINGIVIGSFVAGIMREGGFDNLADAVSIIIVILNLCIPVYILNFIKVHRNRNIRVGYSLLFSLGTNYLLLFLHVWSISFSVLKSGANNLENGLITFTPLILGYIVVYFIGKSKYNINSYVYIFIQSIVLLAYYSVFKNM